MYEAFLMGPNGGPPQPLDIKPIFLYDPQVGADIFSITPITQVLSAGTTVDNSILIDGKSTLRLASTSTGALLTFNTPLTLGADWTHEFAVKYETIPGGSTFPQTVNLMSPTLNAGVYATWGDSGYGNRMFACNASGSEATAWRPPMTKTQAGNKLVKYAFVCKANKVKVYIDGIAQQLTNGNDINYPGKQTVEEFPVTVPLTNCPRISIGASGNGSWTTTIMNVGQIRISNYARYTSNYVPQPFKQTYD